MYMYRKDHPAEFTIFTQWSKKVIPFPSLRWKIQAFKDDKKQNTMIPWNDGNTVQFSVPLFSAFSFQGQFNEQVEGAAMGSPVSPIVANLYMEYLEPKTISTAPHPLGSGAGMWMTPLSFTRKPTNLASSNT